MRYLWRTWGLAANFIVAFDRKGRMAKYVFNRFNMLPVIYTIYYHGKRFGGRAGAESLQNIISYQNNPFCDEYHSHSAFSTLFFQKAWI
jgi:hypothetical protein